MSKHFTKEQLRCLELSRIIRKGIPGIKFGMATYCGTAACIGGHAVAYYNPAMWQAGLGKPMRDEAKRLLGLKEKDVGPMFVPWFYGGPEDQDITSAMAAKMLENYGLTRKVRWEQ